MEPNPDDNLFQSSNFHSTEPLVKESPDKQIIEEDGYSLGKSLNVHVQAEQDKFYQKIAKHTSNWLRGLADIIDEAPSCLDIHQKFFDLSISVTQSMITNYSAQNSSFITKKPILIDLNSSSIEPKT